jgi:hypothetical protein
MRAVAIALAAVLTACASAPDPAPPAPYKIAAGDDALAQRATPTSAAVGEVYHWVHISEYKDIEARLRRETVNTTRRLYTPKDGVRVKYIGKTDVYVWSAATGQIRRGTWVISEGKFGPQICETFYGETACLNTAEQLSGVGRIDKRAGDAFGLARGIRPVIGKDGLPSW